MAGDVTVLVNGYPLLLVDVLGDGTKYATALSFPSSAGGSEIVQVNAASVAFGAYSVLASSPTLGKRWALVKVLSTKAYSLDCWGADAAFTVITAASNRHGATFPGLAANTGTLGDEFLVCCAGRAHFGLRVQNNDGAAAATITGSIKFLD